MIVAAARAETYSAHAAALREALLTRNISE
jgi:hypothetical protein